MFEMWLFQRLFVFSSKHAKSKFLFVTLKILLLLDIKKKKEEKQWFKNEFLLKIKHFLKILF